MGMKVKSKQGILVLIALCSIAFIHGANTINNIVLANIYEEFADASTGLRSYIVSGPQAVAVPFIFLVGWLAQRVGKKPLMLACATVGAIGGILCAFSSSLEMYAVARTFVVIGTSTIGTLILSTAFACFTDPNESATAVGIYQGVSNAAGVIYGPIAGALALSGWRNAHMLNFLSIASILMILVGLPNMKPEGKKNQGSAEAGEGTVKWFQLICGLLEYCIFTIFSFVLLYFASVYISERALGDSTLAGTASTLATLGGVVIGFVFGKVFKVLKRHTGTVAMGIFGILCATLGMNVSAWYLLFVMFCLGLAVGSVSGFYPSVVARSVPASKLSVFQSVYTVVAYLARFAIGYVPTTLIAIFGFGYQQVMMCCGIIIVAAAVVFTLINTATAKNFMDTNS